MSRLRTPAAVQRYLNAPAVQHRARGATLRSFRGVVGHRHRALLRGGDVRRGRARAARLSAARPELRVDRPSGSRAVRRTATPAAGDRSRARAIPACTDGGRSSAPPRALALSYVDTYVDFTRRHQRLRASPICASWGPTTGGSPRARCGRPSGFCSTTRISASAVARRARRRCAARYRAFRARARRSEAGGLRGEGSLDADSARVHGGRTVPVRGTALARTSESAVELGPFRDPALRGRSRSRSLVEIEVPRRPRDRLLVAPASAPLRSASTARRRACVLDCTDCSKRLSRRAASSARMRCASLSSGLSPRSGTMCSTMRSRLRSKTSVAPQQGQVSSSSDPGVACRYDTPQIR